MIFNNYQQQQFKLFVGKQPAIFQTMGVCVSGKERIKTRRDSKASFLFHRFFLTTSTYFCLNIYSCMRYTTSFLYQQTSARKMSFMHEIMNCKEASDERSRMDLDEIVQQFNLYQPPSLNPLLDSILIWI